MESENEWCTPPPGSSYATRHKYLTDSMEKAFRYQSYLWMGIGLLTSLCGWYEFGLVFDLSNLSKIRLLLFTNQITAVLAYIGLKLSLRTIGRCGICIVYLLSMFFMVLVGHLEPAFNINSLMMVTCITAHTHALSQLLRVTEDIGVSDVLLGAIMQAALYVTFWRNIYAFAVVSVICAGAILHKFFTHPAPHLQSRSVLDLFS